MFLVSLSSRFVARRGSPRRRRLRVELTQSVASVIAALACVAGMAGESAHAQVRQRAAQVRVVTVPDVTKRPVREALMVIEKVGLSRGEILPRPSDGEPGIVLDQSLKPGARVQAGTPIDLGVSRAIFTKVPDVRTRRLADAEVMLKKSGLVPGTIVDRPSDGEPGIVLDQSFEPGTPVARNTPVHLGVSQTIFTKVPDATKVPDVTKRRLADAEVMLKKSGLVPGTIVDRPSDGESGIVLDQSLEPGTPVPRNTSIDLGVSRLITVKVPDVTKRRLAAAEVILEKSGLARGTIVDRPSDGESGIVLDQSLEPGTPVPRNTSIDLGVSQLITVKVPDVTKLRLADAEVILKKSNLTRGAILDRPSDGEPGIVLDQSLEPGRPVPRNTLLNLGVSVQRATEAPQQQPGPNPPAAGGNAGENRSSTPSGTPRGVAEQNPASAPPPTSAVPPEASSQPAASRPEVRNQPPGPKPGQSSTWVVPDVRGRTIAEATTLLARAQLKAGPITYRSVFLPPFFQAEGAVFEQNPAGGTTLASPVVVSLVVVPGVSFGTIAVVLLLLATAVAVLIRHRRVAAGHRDAPGHVPSPSVATRVFRDRGEQHVASITQTVSLELRVRGRADRGVQSIRSNGPLA